MSNSRRTLKTSFLAVLIASSVQAQHHHSFQHSNELEPRPVHKGSEFSAAGYRYIVVVSADRAGLLPDAAKKENGRYRLPTGSLDHLWELLANEMPGINFSIVSGKLTSKGTVIVNVDIEGVGDSFNLKKSDVLLSMRPYSHWTGGISLEPELGAYVDFERWNKDTGYLAAKEFLANEDQFIAVTFLMEEFIDTSGQPDTKAYANVLSKMGLGGEVTATKMVVLEDGTRALAKAVNIKRLEALYNETSVINIVPDLNSFQ